MFRQKDKKYAKILNQIRKGTISNNSCRILQERVTAIPDNTIEITPTILLPVKRMVEKINKDSLNAINEEVCEYTLKECEEEDLNLSVVEKSKLMEIPKSILSK